MSTMNRTGKIYLPRVLHTTSCMVSFLVDPASSHLRLRVLTVRRPLWHYGLVISLCIFLWHLWHNTPTIASEDLRSRRPEYCTRQAYSRLLETHAVLARENRPCTHNQHLYWHWNDRFETEIMKAKDQGRRIVYDRMRLFNPVKEPVD